ncbi:hypothetical protein DPMN_023844 [Dreissena polymorpha]|uniref:Uncharacterized protein n=1 Tax=Dreissena polymorpha TaxID=45954 RepID=A0A9D4LMV1_DREPO|nr:hypothetical protein DPMN_023844 [Dreissena polymorpha]
MPLASQQSTGLLMYRSYTGTLSAFTGLHRGVAVALPGSEWAPVELRCRPGASRAAPVVAGPSR